MTEPQDASDPKVSIIYSTGHTSNQDGAAEVYVCVCARAHLCGRVQQLAMMDSRVALDNEINGLLQQRQVLLAHRAHGTVDHHAHALRRNTEILLR